MAKAAGWFVAAGVVGLAGGALLLGRRTAEASGGEGGEVPRGGATVAEDTARREMASRLLREHGVVGTSVPNSGARLPSHIYITRDTGELAIRFSIGEDAEGDVLHYQVRVRSQMWAGRDILSVLKEPPVARLPAGEPFTVGLALDRTHGPGAMPPLQFQVDAGLAASSDNWPNNRGVLTDWRQTAVLSGQTFPVTLGRDLVMPTSSAMEGTLLQLRLIIATAKPVWQNNNLAGIIWDYYRLLDDYAAQQSATGGVLLPVLISVV